MTVVMVVTWVFVVMIKLLQMIVPDTGFGDWCDDIGFGDWCADDELS